MKYPSSKFLYSVTLDNYSKALSNYEKIYDRINIVLAFCGTLLLATINNVNISLLLDICTFPKYQKIVIIVYGIMAIASVVLLVISIIQLLLLSRSRNIISFDCNSIKEYELYRELTEDVALWIILKYIRIINDLREMTQEKQHKLDKAILLFIVSLLLYIASVLMYNGGLS